VASAVERHFRPVKLNYQLLGNAVPHLHTHLVPRYADDPAPGRPLDFPDGARPEIPADRLRRDAQALRALI
jgi:diadenosine tetraphosphate (Ap4A) HIT family hydrolase